MRALLPHLQATLMRWSGCQRHQTSEGGEESYVTCCSPRNAKPSSFYTASMCQTRMTYCKDTCSLKRCAHLEKKQTKLEVKRNRFHITVIMEWFTSFPVTKQQLQGELRSLIVLSPLNNGINFISFSQQSCLASPINSFRPRGEHLGHLFQDWGGTDLLTAHRTKGPLSRSTRSSS